MWLAPHFETLQEDKQWMTDYGCLHIAEEQAIHEKFRPEWKQMIDNMGTGDELVVSKFSNAIRGPRELAVFFEICRIKGIRLISIHDKIDSANKLFCEINTSDILNMFGSLSSEVVIARKSIYHLYKQKSKPQARTRSAIAKLERNKMILNMYKSGRSIQEIFNASGFSSRSSVFRVLRDAGLDFDRGHTKGPLKKKTLMLNI